MQSPPPKTYYIPKLIVVRLGLAQAWSQGIFSPSYSKIKCDRIRYPRVAFFKSENNNDSAVAFSGIQAVSLGCITLNQRMVKRNQIV